MVRSTDSATRLERDLQAVAEGRSDRLELGRGGRYYPVRELPEAVRELTGLRFLRLTGSDVVELPEWLGELPLLETVDARGSSLAGVPPMPWIRWALDAGQLWSLRRVINPVRVYGVAVDASDDPAVVDHLAALTRQRQLTLAELTVGTGQSGPATLDSRFDDIIGHSPGLRRLSLMGCPPGRVPQRIRDLHRLTHLRLAGVRPAVLPDWLFALPALTSLDLGDNRLADLPAALAQATRLVALCLRDNPLREIPAGVWDLTGLATLDLRGCPVRRIPAEILRLRSLADLRVDATSDVVVPPPEVAARGLDAIRSYWSQERKAGVDYLSEAKLLIVGEPEAGKTTLAKKILDSRYQLDPDEGSTEGIGVFPWRFPSAVRVAGPAGERLVQRDFRVNVWDFGGQEIYHSTHQFFLTRRSVYVLVSDGRKEDTDFRYWLETVKLLSDRSPLIIVQNRKQGRAQEIDLRTLRQDYPNLVEVISLDLADNSGLGELITKARRELELLPHIGTALPRTWQDVRMALERDERDHIAADEFFRICAAHGFTREQDMRQLGGFLHDLGICLYFQEDPLLSKTMILKPEWGTQAVYRALDDHEIVARLGVFGPADLRRIWPEPRYASMRDELVRLMEKFALCFPVPGTDRHVAPQLLSPVRPVYSWEEPGDLALRYEYDVMPKGIVRRLIVELHDLIDGGSVWRTGVVFRYHAGRAEVIEDYRRRRLHIKLAPRDPRVMLAVIDRALDKIHRSYPDLRFERLRPCGCDVCGTVEEPTMYGMRELEDFARAGDPIQCRAGRRLVDAAALLSELWQPGDAAAEPAHRTSADEVFVSYKWGGAADALVDQMVDQLAARGLVVTRDRNVLRYRDPIRRFMRRLGSGKFVIVVLDDAYLKSKNCMFELTEVAARDDFAKAVFPVVLPDADIFDARGRLAYVEHWEQQRDELDAAMRRVGQEKLEGIREELDLYEEIRNTIAAITGVLGDMNTLTAATHAETDFSDLWRALGEARGR